MRKNNVDIIKNGGKTMEIKISDGLYCALHDYCEETETDMNEFIIDAIIDKINEENTLFNSSVNEDGWENGKTSTENYLNL